MKISKVIRIAIIFRKLNVDLKEIELIEALLFLSMIPLHYDDSDRQLAFYKSNRDYKQIIKIKRCY